MIRRCPDCNRKIKYYCNTTGIFVCGHCPWRGLKPVEEREMADEERKEEKEYSPFLE